MSHGDSMRRTSKIASSSYIGEFTTAHRLQLAEMAVESSRMVLEKPSNLLIALSPDGSLLVMATEAQSRSLLIDPHSLETLARLPAKDQKLRSLAFDLNGRYFATAGGTVTLWDLALVRGELLQRGLDFHESTTEEHADLFSDLLRRSSRRDEKARIIATAAPLSGVLEVLAERANDDVPFLIEMARYFTQKGDLPRADAARKQALFLLEDQLTKVPGNEAAEEGLIELLLIDPSTDLNGVLERVPAAATRVGDLHFATQNWQSAIAAYSLVITEETTDVALLQKRAEAYAAVRQWESAAEDWLRVVELRPDQLLQAFKLFLKAERWTEASRFALQLARESPPTASEQWMPLAVAQVLARDREGYVEVCEGMRETFADSEIAIHAVRTVKICLLWPEAIDPASLPSEKFIRELDDGTAPEGYKPWYWTARAILALRSKDAESAATYVANSEANAPSANCHVLNLTLLAQTEHERNRHAEARKTLEQASQLLAQFREFPSAKGDHDLLIAEILFREAEAKINR